MCREDAMHRQRYLPHNSPILGDAGFLWKRNSQACAYLIILEASGNATQCLVTLMAPAATGTTRAFPWKCRSPRYTIGRSVTGNGNGTYNGLLEINAYLDTAKLGWWSGGLLAAIVQTSWGNPLQGEVGNISPVNATPMWPVPFHNTTGVMEYYLTQGLPHEILFIGGRIDPTNFLVRKRAWT